VGEYVTAFFETPTCECWGLFLSKKIHYNFHFEIIGWDKLIDDIVNVIIGKKKQDGFD
tara:strand:- start:1388 stop:1561 length:174 start_codon:yes stop_codon:yes gene_type:complete